MRTIILSPCSCSSPREDYRRRIEREKEGRREEKREGRKEGGRRGEICGLLVIGKGCSKPSWRSERFAPCVAVITPNLCVSASWLHMCRSHSEVAPRRHQET